MDFLIPEDLKDLKNMVRTFVRKELMPLEEEVERTGKIPEEALQKMRELGFFGLTIPTEYGGSGIGTFGYCLAAEELGWAHSAFKTICGVNNGIGSKPIVLDGTEEQKRKYLPKIASGEYITAFALSEPGAGSDAANISTQAVRKGDRYIINGRKHFITNGPLADLITVLAVTDKEKRAHGGITAFLVEKGTPGFSVGQIHKTMGSRGVYHSELIFDNCEVPAENVIGKEGMGFITAMKTLDDGRLTLAASCVGTAERLLEMSTEYAKRRVTFGKPIAERQAIQWMLADSATEIYAAKMMVYATAIRYDKGERIPAEVAMTKLYATEMVNRVADRAVQIHGGMGWIQELPVERIYRDVRVTRLYEGTSEIQRIIIARNILGYKGGLEG